MNWTVSAAIAMGACVREGRRVPVEAGAAGAALSSLVSISWACGGAGGPRPGMPRRSNVAEQTSVPRVESVPTSQHRNSTHSTLEVLVALVVSCTACGIFWVHLTSVGAAGTTAGERIVQLVANFK